MKIANKISIFIDYENWVMFSRGTIVALHKESPNMEEQAIKLLKKFGPFQVATQSADIYPAKALDDNHKLWLVSYPYFDQIFNFINVGEDFEKELNEEDAVNISLAGRDNRSCDANDPRIVGVIKGKNKTAQ